ncbi:MAG: helix-turn-helix domain-containing protein [Pseudomonadota bacterium]
MNAPSHTVREAAQLLQLHPKTVLRKVRDGELPATKIGKQYRISRAALEEYSGGTITFPEAKPATKTRKILASTVIDVDAISPDESTRITNSAMAVLAGRHNGGARVDCLYYEESGKLKIVVHGDLHNTQEILALVATLLRPDDE